MTRGRSATHSPLGRALLALVARFYSLSLASRHPGSSSASDASLANASAYLLRVTASWRRRTGLSALKRGRFLAEESK
jgi:hypothetical protein